MQSRSNNNAQINRPDKGTVLTVIIAVVFVLLTLAVRFFVFTSFITDGISMDPTYDDGQRVWVYKTDDIKRGDVIVVKDGQNNKYLIKRVVAFEGDCLRAVTDDGINYRIQIKYKGENEWLEENYQGVALPTFPDDFNLLDLLGCIPIEGEYVVKEGVFLMGDNRLVSSDSRERGEFSLSLIQGKVVN